MKLLRDLGLRCQLLALIAPLFPGNAIAAPLIPVIGGPTFSSTSGGFAADAVFTANDSGVAVGYGNQLDASQKNGFGERAARFGPSANSLIPLADLGTTSKGIANTYAYSINDSGIAAGTSERYGAADADLGNRPVVWDSNGNATELANFGTSSGVTSGEVSAINDAGMMYGDLRLYDSSGKLIASKPVRWTSMTAQPAQLDTPGGGSINGGVSAMNSAGLAAGIVGSYDQLGSYTGTRPVRWGASSTTCTPMGILNTDDLGFSSGLIYAVSDTGTVVGNWTKYAPAGGNLGIRPVRWDTNGAITELNTLGTSSTGIGFGTANAINQSNQIVGAADKYVAGVDEGTRPVLWNSGSTTPIELGILGTNTAGQTNGDALSISDTGLIVGGISKYDSSGNFLGQTAVMWGPDHSVVDLNTLIDPNSGWYLNKAMAINDAGWITGFGSFDPDGAGPQAAYTRLFLIQVPEPAMTGVVLLPLCWAVAKRKPSEAPSHNL